MASTFSARICLIKQLLYSFLVFFIPVFSFVALALITEPEEVKIHEISGNTQANFSLKMDNQLNLTIEFFAPQTIHLAQAIIEFDHNYLTPKIDKLEKLTSLDRFKTEIIDNNHLRISATNINPDSIDVNHLSGVSGSQTLAKVPFMVKTLSSDVKTNINLIVVSGANSVDSWKEASALLAINPDASVDNLLDTPQKLELNLPRTVSSISPPLLTPSTPTPSPIPSPFPPSFASPTSLNFDQSFYNLFNTATDSATEIIQSSESAEPEVNVSAEVLPPPTPESVSLPIWQRFFVFLSSLLGL